MGLVDGEGELITARGLQNDGRPSDSANGGGS